MNEFEVTGFADNIFCTWLIGGLYKCLTIITFSCIENLLISQFVSFSVSLVRMFGGEGQVIFYIKCEFLFDDLEWFFCNTALEYSSNYFIDIFLSCFVANYFLIILLCVSRCYKRTMIRWRFFLSFPLPSSFSYFRFWERIILICNCFVVAKRGEPSGEKFTPFSCRLHVVDDFPSKSLVFSDGIGCIEDAVVVFFERDTSEVIMRIKTRYAVYIVAACPVLYTKTVVRRVYTIIDTFISPLWVTSYGRYVHIIFWISPYVFSVFAVLRIVHMKTLQAVFTISHIISNTIFTLEYVPKFLRKCFYELFLFFEIMCLSFWIRMEKFLNKCFELFRSHFSVENIIRFIDEVDTSETFMTGNTVWEVIALAAVITVLAPKKRMAVITITDFIAVFTLVYICTIDAMIRFLEPATILTKFIVGWFINEITVSAVSSEVGKFTILILRGNNIYLRNTMVKLAELFKKRSIEIKIRSIIKRVPIIAPPDFLIVDNVWFIRWVDCNERIACFIAFSVIQFSFISPRESSALSFFRTKCGWRNCVFYSSKNRRFFVVIGEIFIGHKKIFSRNSAFLGLYDVLSGWYKTHKIW